MVSSDGFAELLRELLTPLGCCLTMRRMFGATGVFADGLMFGVVSDDTLYFRVDDHYRAAFREAASFPPLPMRRRAAPLVLAFWRAPERLFDEPESLLRGHEQRWRRRVGSRQRENEQRQGEKSKPRPK
jgi:DNA transformation protein and related proteins